MNLLSAKNISKNYADRWLFKDLNFGLQLGQRVAFVGGSILQGQAGWRRGKLRGKLRGFVHL